MKHTFFILFFAYSVISFSQIQLSPKAEVSILTVNPGESLNDTWGHSAIRIQDRVIGFDVVFNYGMYDFNTPNFYTKFMRGKLLFDLGVNQFNGFLNAYKRQNRGVTEQVLDLTHQEKQAYFDFLQNNAKPENRKYLYDFFFDNCATKLREVNTSILNTNVIYNDSVYYTNYTFRDLIYQKLEHHSWGKFGIDLALGAVIDRKATPKELSFLPSYAYEMFKAAKIKKAYVTRPLVKQTNTLYKERKIKTQSILPIPFVVFSIVALLVLYFTYLDYKKKRQTKIIDFSLLFITGLVGLLVFLLWFATDHTATKNNFNILWAFFPNLIIAFYVFKLERQLLLKKYYIFLLLLLVVVIVLWVFGVQIFNMALIPILIMLIVRYYYNYTILE